MQHHVPVTLPPPVDSLSSPVSASTTRVGATQQPVSVASQGSATSVCAVPGGLWELITTYAPLLTSRNGQAVLPSVVSELRSYLETSGRRFDKIYYVDLAVEATRNFQWPPEVYRRDLKRLREAGSIRTLAS